MKTSELTGKDLDHWVAKAQGWKKHFDGNCTYSWESQEDPWFMAYVDDYSPTSNDGQAFALIEKFKITTGLVNRKKDTWFAIGDDQSVGYALDPRTAICRAVVASEFGDEVSK